MLTENDGNPHSATPYAWLSLLLQTADPLFPTGAYAHSLGLEEMVRLEIVRDEATLLAFLHQQIVPSLERFELPLLRSAHEAAAQGDVPALVALHSELDAWKLATELREASLQLGTRRLQALLKIAPTPCLKSFAAATGGVGHHLAVYGLQCAAMPLEAALLAAFYQTCAGHCSAALKLIRIGQDGCQRVLRDVLLTADAAVRTSQAIPRAEAGCFNPMLEIASMRHQRAFERLFIS